MKYTSGAPAVQGATEETPLLGKIIDILTGGELSQDDIAAKSKSVLQRPIAVTRFRNKAGLARDTTERQLSLEQLAQELKATTKKAKSSLPGFKLQRYGDRPLPGKTCLRNNLNVLAVSGVEADYDGERMSPEEAARLLGDADIAALIYTTSSHAPQTPRWRVFCPFGEERPPAARAAFLARLNGVLGGVLDPSVRREV